MVFAREAAVIIKGRDGRTVLLQSRGMDFQVASLAAGEAMAALQAAAQAPESWDVLSNTQAVPFLSGRLEVMHHKLTVTYRVAGGLIFLVVTAPAANVFSCIHLLNGIVRVAAVQADGKSAELNPERLQRRFGEVYMAVDALLSSGGVLDPNTALGRALATLEQLQDRDKGKGVAEAAQKPPQQQRPGGKPFTRRTLQGMIDQLALLSFSAGPAMQGIQARPGFQLQEAVPQAMSRPKQEEARDPFPIDLGSSVPKVPRGKDPNDPFPDLDWAAPEPSKTPEVVTTTPATTTTTTATMTTTGGAGGAGVNVDPVPVAPPPVYAPFVLSEPVLRLVEIWRGETSAGQLVRAGVSGRVEWISEAAKAKVHTVQLMLQVPEASCEHLPAALAASRRHPDCCRAGPTGGLLLADGIQAKRHEGALLLYYHLPPLAIRLPMQAQLGASILPTQDGRHLVTLGLHYAVNPVLAQRAAGLALEIVVPALLERPLRTSPPGAVFDAKARTLRWQQPGPVSYLDNHGTAVQPFLASFAVDEAVASEAALPAALVRLNAKLSLLGADGSGTLTGASLAQGVVDLEVTPSLCGWRAELTATL
ncbi:hypothetical protein VaNZ11_014834 [Volvox africanus]|uniref:MHD domain-containing protein n=1 Tax=Volvox africanus TaxID=51714 RepID=A0ABQ5SKP8_9CHLO|nr:hypothetical protein VaNZ11_014834 [Volvox africanus]